MLELGLPLALAALPLPLLVLWLAPARREVVQAVRIPFFEGASAGLDKGEGAVVEPRSWGQMAFAWTLWALVVLTLARPAWVGDPVERTEAARDIMLAVDISGSMQTRDFVGRDGARGTRLDGVKSVLDAFVSQRKDDRIGLIVFGSAPYVLVPFTRDTEAARALLATLEPGMAGQNTMLGDAIGLAIRSFEASKVEARTLILLSDGTDTGSRMPPAKAADIAAQNGVVIDTIAVGDPEAASDSEKVDIATLQQVAKDAGGSFDRAEDARSLADIYAQIDAAGARQGATVSWRPRTPLTALPAAAFVVLVLAGYLVALAGAALRRRARTREATA
jgi:Ca-activated chloride channel family protein